jgi:predicted permease
MQTLHSDLKFALRQLLKNPGFTAVAVAVLALGIGANSAIFSLVSAFVLRPLPLREPERLIGLYNESTRTPDSYRGFSYPNFADIREQNSAFESVTAHNLTMVGLTEGETTRRLFADCVTANYFSTLGTRLAHGRFFTLEEEQPGAAVPVVIVSHKFWQKAGGAAGFVGSTLRLNGRPFTVVGITRPGFTGTMPVFSPDVWLPLGVYDSLKSSFDDDLVRTLKDRDSHSLLVVGRLKPGVTIEGATAELKVAGDRLAKTFPRENGDWSVMAWPLPRLGISTSPEKDDGQFGAMTVMLLSMAGVVLLIACLNLANMLLARGSARRKEIAIRLALGGGRGTIVRQLLTEGLVLALLGGGVGLLFACWGMGAFVGSMQPILPMSVVFDATPDFRVLAATTGFCVLGTLFFALGPALKLSRPEVVGDLKDHAGEEAARWGFFAPRNLLVLGQVALCLTLLTAAGLFIRGALNAANADPGFRIPNGILGEIDSSIVGYNEPRGRDLAQQLVQKLSALPGVESATISATVPFGFLTLGREVQRAGAPATAPADARAVTPAEGKTFSSIYNSIGPDYFKTIGLRVLQGREFTVGEALQGGSPPVAIVDDVLAEKLFPGESALGRRIQFATQRVGAEKSDDDGRVGASSGTLKPGEKTREMEIVGIVPRVRNGLFEKKPQPHVYVPFAQSFHANAHLQLRTRAATPEAQATLLQTVRREIRQLDERLPVLTLRTFEDHLKASAEVWIVRTGAALFSMFGGLALLLAVVGVYGLKAYVVARRTREIGIRMALGARATDVVWMILRDGVKLTVVGIVIGLLLAAGVGKLLASQLYEVSALDPICFLTAPLVLIAAVLLACLIPARRAAKVDPMVALRSE